MGCMLGMCVYEENGDGAAGCLPELLSHVLLCRVNLQVVCYWLVRFRRVLPSLL